MEEASGERSAHAAQNQDLFRTVNERVRDLSSGFADLSHVSDWVCECANVSCTERINLTAEEYERVRAESADFLISPSQEHVVPEVEDVLNRHEEYWVVRKTGEAGLVATRLDRRVSKGNGVAPRLTGLD